MSCVDKTGMLYYSDIVTKPTLVTWRKAWDCSNFIYAFGNWIIHQSLWFSRGCSQCCP